MTKYSPQDSWAANQANIHSGYPAPPKKKIGAAGITGIVVGGVILACCGFAGLGAALEGTTENSASSTPSGTPSSVALFPTTETSASASAAPIVAVQPSKTAAPKPKPTKTAPKPAAPYYRNCDAVRAAGKAPLREGDPGFRPALDRDGDGEACEPDRGNGDTGPAPDGDVYYANCTEVREAGAAPIRRGDAGYSRKLDRDGDGIACE